MWTVEEAIASYRMDQALQRRSWHLRAALAALSVALLVSVAANVF